MVAMKTKASPEIGGAVNGSSGRSSEDSAQIRHVTFTPHVADSYLRLYSYPRQRGLRHHHVEYLAAAMRRGEFKPGVIELRRLGDQVLLIDGQHRLSAIVKSGLTFDLVVLERDAASIEDVDADYARMDRGIARGMGDSLRAYGLSDTLGLTQSQMNRASAAIVPIVIGFTPVSTSPAMLARKTAELRQRAMLDWQEEIRAYMEIVGNSKRGGNRRLGISAVAAVAFVTLRYQQERAADFWQAVKDNDGLRRGDPAKTLIEFLVENIATSRSTHIYARAVAQCWNAAYENRELLIVRVLPQTAEAPIRIAGTPYNGEQIIRPYDDGRSQ